MTEQEFQCQVWRAYDQITTANGVKGKVLNVCFATKSVRAYIAGAPEWIRCELIETHTTGKGANGNDAEIIEGLHNKLMAAEETIARMKEERQNLVNKLSKNHVGDILNGINLIKENILEKKKKIQRIEDGLERVQVALDKINRE